jgi:hypothetical protein
MIEQLTQMLLDGTPIKSCSVTVKVDGNGTVKASIGGKKAAEIVQAIIDIVSRDDHRWRLNDTPAAIPEKTPETSSANSQRRLTE